MEVVTVSSDADAVSLIMESNQQISGSDSFTYTPGEILTSTLWDQSGTVYIYKNGRQTSIGGSYNKFSPYISSSTTTRSVTGCTNTADAQILYYWLERGYDLNLTVSTSDYFESASDSKTYYVSDSPALGEGAMSTVNSLLAAKDMDNADFIAALNYYCGVKNHSSFGSSTSTSWWSGSHFNGKNSAAYVAAGFDSYFFISATSTSTSAKQIFTTTGLSDVGFSIVRENIDYGEPIRVGIPGHAIYLDGYRFNETTQEYEYHLNYGWGVNSSSSKWYTVEGLEDLSLTYINIDLSPDIYVNVTNARNDYYGGSFTRGLERINHIQKEKATTFSFDDSIAGSTISLTTSAALTSAVDVDFLNFNVNFQTTAANGFSSNDAMSFELTDASIVVNNSSSTAKAVYESGSEKLIIELDSSWIYAGYSSSGGSYIISMLEDDNGYYYTSVNSTMLTNATGYAVYSGSASDTITLTNSSAIFGKINLGAGANTITVENGSLIYGKFEGSAGTVTVNMQINGTANGAMIVAGDATSEDNLYSISNGTFNVKIGSGATAKSYTLYTGYSAEDTLNFKVKLTVGDTTYTLDRNNRSAGNYTLVYDGTSMRLQYGATVASNVKIYSSGTLTSQGSSFTNAIIRGGANNAMQVSSGGIASNTYISSGGAVHVFNKGLTSSTNIYSGGVLNVSSGGSAVFNYVNNGAELNAYNGAVVSQSFVYSGGWLVLSSGATAKYTTVNSSGAAVVFSGAVASNNSAYTYGDFFVNGGQAYSNTISGTSAYLGVYSGGYASKTSVLSNGWMSVFSNGSASYTTLSSATLYVGDIAKVSTTYVSKGGCLNVYNAGSAYYNYVYNGGDMLVSSGGSAFYTTVNSGGDLTVFSSGLVSSATISSGAVMTLSSGAIIRGAVDLYGTIAVSGAANASGATINLRVSNRSTADSYMVSNLSSLSGASYTITVSYGQTLGSYKLASGASSFNGTITVRDNNAVNYGTLSVGGSFAYNGKTYTLNNSGGNLTLVIAEESKNVKVYSSSTLTSQGTSITGATIQGGGNNSMFISNGGTANSTTVNSGGQMNISSGGTANYTVVNSNGRMYIYSKVTANSTTVNSGGSMYISSGGSATYATVNGVSGCSGVIYVSGTIKSATVNSEGYVYVNNGGIASNTNLKYWGELRVSSGGSAVNNYISSGGWLFNIGGYTSNTYVYNGGDFRISTDAYASNTVVSSGGEFTVNNATAVGATIRSGIMYVYGDTGTGISATVSSGGMLQVYSNGLASYNTISSSGAMNVFSNGMAAYTTVASGGRVFLDSGTIHFGTMKIAKGAVVSAYRGSMIAFTLDNETVSSEYIINNLSLIQGAPYYAITVTSDLNTGIYNLAQGAAGFNESITITSAGDSYGTLYANGGRVMLDGKSYELMLSDGNLTLKVGGGGSNPDSVVAGDLDGNGYADTILYHTKQGYSGAWLTTGDKSVIKWGSLANIKAGTEIIGTGKIHGTADDGQDIFFTDGKTVGAWNIINGKVTGYKTIMNVNSTTNVLGLGDFNGDGTTDILLRSTNGDLGFYDCDGSGWQYLKGLGREWSIAAIGDLNGDGIDDVVLQHDAGFAGTFLTQRNGTVKWANLDTLKDGIKIIGTGDFNGDGVEDVLLQNKSNGWVGAWLVEDGSVAGFMGICKNKNTIEQIADFNGDGIDDLRVRAGSDIGVLYVNGADDTTWQYFQSVGKEWDTSFSLLS